MQLRFQSLGGALEIGASCHLISDGDRTLALDCGLHPKLEGKAALPDFAASEFPNPRTIIISHCHHDHIGALPVGLQRWSGARAILSRASRPLASRMMQNALAVQRRRQRDDIRNRPLFEQEGLDLVEKRLQDVELHTPFDLNGRAPRGGTGPFLQFLPSGHILGAVGTVIDWHDQRIFHTGDIHLEPQGILDAAELPPRCDTLIMESTLGMDLAHDDWTRPREVDRLGTAIREVLDGGGSVLIPAFALGKTQELLKVLDELTETRRIPAVPIFIGGLGRAVNDIYDAVRWSYPRRDTEFTTSTLRPVVLPRDHLEADDPFTVPSIYLVTSGMIQRGTPSWQLARKMLGEPRHAIFFVGYVDHEADGYPIHIAETGDTFRWSGAAEPVTMRCRKERFRFSAHARRKHLVAMAQKLRPGRIILVHGSPGALDSLKDTLADLLPEATVDIAWPRRVIDL